MPVQQNFTPATITARILDTPKDFPRCCTGIFLSNDHSTLMITLQRTEAHTRLPETHCTATMPPRWNGQCKTGVNLTTAPKSWPVKMLHLPQLALQLTVLITARKTTSKNRRCSDRMFRQGSSSSIAAKWKSKKFWKEVYSNRRTYTIQWTLCKNDVCGYRRQ